MIRFFLNVILALLALRFLFWSARFVTSLGRRVTGAGRRQVGGVPPDEGDGTGYRDFPRESRIDRSGAIDVPFTEIEPEAAMKTAKPAEGKPASRGLGSQGAGSREPASRGAANRGPGAGRGEGG